jgi:ribosomal protein L34
MKVRIRKSNTKRARCLGFLARKKTRGGRKIIARQRKRYGAYRGWNRS